MAFVLASSTVARADRRNFAFSYDAVTLGKGQIEVEQYLTSRSFRDPLVGDHDTGWQYQLELEYGVTDHFDVAAYQVFGTGKPDGEMDWSGYKLRGRYRPSDQGEWFIDPVVYLELIQSADGGITLEQKLILGRVFGRFITTLNLTFEQEHLNQDEQEYVIAPSFAAGFQPWPWLTLGGEVLSKTAFEDGETEHMAFAGPAISLAHGRLWLTVTMLTRFAGGEVDALREDYRIRGILGLYL